MKHTKREWIPLYNFLDRTRLTAHLSEMAAQGWLLTSISIPGAGNTAGQSPGN